MSQVSLRSYLILLSTLSFICVHACSDQAIPIGSTTGGGEAGSEVIVSGDEGGISLGGRNDLPETCVVGENLGLCAVCGQLLTPIMPINDGNCPPIDCSSLTQYQSMNIENGGRVCLQYLADPPTSSCKELGVCYESPEDACILNPTPIPLVTVYPGCGEFTGCEGDISPDGSQKPEGAECHSLGTCGASGCSAPPSCSGIHPEFVREFCPEPNAPEQCDKYIDLNGVDNAGDIDCTIACATIGQCQTGWDSNGGCNRGEEIGCSTRRERLICRCEL